MLAPTLTRPAARAGEFDHLCPRCGEYVATGMEALPPEVMGWHMSDHRPYCPAVAVEVPFAYDDGGREAAGFKGDTRDCGTRALAIVTGMGYREAYDAINAQAKAERTRKGKKPSNARTGVWRWTLQAILEPLGYEWVPTMAIGSGTTVHLRPDELPAGRLIVACSRHFTTVIDGVVHDTYDPSRGGTRAVYGYWILGGKA